MMTIASGYFRKLWFCLSIALVTGAAYADEPFSGKIGRSFPQSVLGEEPRPPAMADSPNIIVWVIDDLGFGQLGSFGGVIETPNIDRLASEGLRFTNYHTTPICSSSRAALLTGRNSHHVHIGGHSAMAINFPGQDGRVPRSAGTVANNLAAAGYLTYAIGKWDHLPPGDASPAGPYTYWPSGQGFERFYGFLSFDTDNFQPVLWADHEPVSLEPDPNYHLSEDMADRAIEWINMRDGGTHRRPFFLYWATGAVHAPHHAPKAWIDRYKGKFDAGWDVMQEAILDRQKTMGLVPGSTPLPPRPDDMLSWNALSRDQQRMYARAMETFAAQLSHADEQFGRIVANLEKRGEIDDTIILITSDNGASAEGAPEGTFSEHLMANGILPDTAENLKHYDAWGGPDTYPHYPFGWAVAGNTPFRYYKQTAYEGGVRVPLIVFWPKGIAHRGKIRHQFHHVIDIAPTILDLAGVRQAVQVNGVDQMPFDGMSMAGSIADGSVGTPHHTQYFEMYGNRAIWHEGWKAVVPHRLKTWDFITPPPISDDGWELYNLQDDINELRDLAAAYPDRLTELKAAFDAEARKFHVYPLTNTGEAQKVILAEQNKVLQRRNGVWRYTGPVMRIPESNGPPLHTHSFNVAAEVLIPEQSNGVVMARAGAHGGMSLYLLNGVPTFTLRNLDLSTLRLSGDEVLTPGKARLEVSLTREQPGASVALKVNGKVVGSGRTRARMPVWILSNSETFDIGADTGSSVSLDYRNDFPFDGEIEAVVIDVEQ